MLFVNKIKIVIVGKSLKYKRNIILWGNAMAYAYAELYFLRLIKHLFGIALGSECSQFHGVYIDMFKKFIEMSVCTFLLCLWHTLKNSINNNKLQVFRNVSLGLCTWALCLTCVGLFRQ